MKILVADDDPLNRKYLRVLLTHERHAVVECEDGLAALTYLEQNPCDAVISDVLMPRMDGFRLCYEIRKNNKLQATPIILYTASYLSSADEKAALAMGADRFIRKPAVPKLIVKTLHELIEAGPSRRTEIPHEPKDSSALREYSEVLVRKLEETNVELLDVNEALWESEERLRLAASAGNIGMWEWNPTTDQLVWSEQQKLLFGWPTDREALTFQQFLSAIEPQDRDRIQNALQTALANRSGYELEYRVFWPDGSLHWIAGRGRGDYDDAGRCLRMRGIALDITRRKQAEAERQRTLERIRALHEIGMAINSSLDLQTILDTLLEKIDLFIPYPSASAVRLLNKDSGRLEGLACRNLDATEWKDYSDVTPVGRAKQALASKLPVIVRNVLTNPETVNPSIYQRLGVVSFVAVPLIIKGEGLGILNFFAKEEHEFSSEEIEFLMTLAGQAAVAIHNARLYQENERSRREAEALAQIARSLTETLDMTTVGERVVSSVLALFGVKGATLRLRESDGSLRRFATMGDVFSQTSEGAVVPAGMGLASRALAEEKPVWSTDTLNDPGIHLSERMREYLAQSGHGSMIAVPLRARENIIGVLMLGDRTGRRYPEGEVALLQTFADQVALALQNARLYEQSQSHLKRIEALREIDRAITSTLDLRSVLGLLLEKIDVFLPFPAVTTIRLFNPATGKFENTACRNINEQEWKSRIGLGTGNLSGQILKTKRPVLVPNIQEDAQRSALLFYRRYGLISYLGVPLIAKDEVLGILGFYTKTAHEFTQQETDFLLTLAGQAAIAIHNAQLHEETARSKQELETTNRYLEKSLQQLGGLYTALTPIAPAATTQEMLSGIVGRLMEATGADAALIRFSDKNAGGHPILNQRGFSDEFAQLVGMAPAGGAVDWVVRNAAPLIAPDLASDTRFKSNAQLRLGFRSCAILPLKVHEEVRGVIHVSSRKAGYFDHEQENNLLAIARQMGIAMENRELFYNLESSRDEIEQANTALTESNRRLSALHAVAAASSQSLNLDRVLDSAIQKITDIFHFDATQIHVYDKQLDELRLKASFENDPARFTAARSCKIGQGIVGKVAQTGEKLIFTDVQTDPRYGEFSRTKTSGQHGYHFFAVFPMKGKTQTLGTIACIGNHRRELATSEVQLLEAISDQLAVAIENGELYDDVRLKVEQLQQKTAELEQANKIKDEFLGVVSHELRTPLNVIMGYTALFKDGVFGEIKPAQEDALAKLVRESENLLAMIDSILQATVLDTERIVVESQEFSLESLLAELRANYAVTVPRQLSVRWNYPTDLPPLKTDRRKLKQILDNIIGNAVKFTEQGQVTVSAALCEAPASESEACVVDRKNGKLHPAPETPQPWIEFKVADTGAGISSDALTRIFDKFFQADSSETRRYGGVGIGLYIVKKFTELLGGKIKAESPVGGGSTFTVYIPRKIPGKILSETVDSTEAQSQTDN